MSGRTLLCRFLISYSYLYKQGFESKFEAFVSSISGWLTSVLLLAERFHVFSSSIYSQLFRRCICGNTDKLLFVLSVQYSMFLWPRWSHQCLNNFIYVVNLSCYQRDSYKHVDIGALIKTKPKLLRHPLLTGCSTDGKHLHVSRWELHQTKNFCHHNQFLSPCWMFWCLAPNDVTSERWQRS